MRNLHFFIVTLILTFEAAHSIESLPLPRVPIPLLKSEYQFDGRLDEDFWNKVAAMDHFVDKYGVLMEVQTSVRILKAERGLLIGIRCEEPEMNKVVAKTQDKDKGVWSDDSVELMLATSEKSENYYRFIVNSSGVQEDGIKTDPAALWNVEWESKSFRGVNFWSVEILIPFNSLKSIPSDNQIWRFNVGRYRTNKTQISSWSNCQGNFHRNSVFGELYFSSIPYDVNTILDLNFKKENLSTVIDLDFDSKKWAITGRWMLDGKVESSELDFKADTKGKKAIFFHRFPGEENIFQYEVSSQKEPQEIFYRSNPITISKLTEQEAIVYKISKIINKLTQETQLHAEEKELIRNFQNNTQSKQEQELGEIYRKFRYFQWKRELAPSQAQSLGSFISYPVEPFSHDGYVFSEIQFPSRWEKQIEVCALQGDFVTFCINITNLSKTQQTKFNVKLGDLKNSQGNSILMGRSADLSILKTWYQAGRGGKQSLGRGVKASELLLKNDKLVVIDDKNADNQVLSLDQPEALVDFAINRFETRQIWGSLLIPDRTLKGKYQGNIEVSSTNGERILIPIAIEVIQLKLERKSFDLSSYVSREFQIGGDRPMSLKAYEAHLKMLGDYGYSSQNVIEDVPTVVENGAVKSFDFTHVRKAVQLRKKYGLDGPTMVMSHLWGTPGLRAVWGLKDDLLDSEKSKIHEKNWKKFCVEINQIFKEEKMSAPLIYCWDEPAYDTTGKKLLYHRQLVKWTREAGALSIGAITLPAMLTSEGKVDPLMQDYPILDSPSNELSSQRRVLPLKHAWLYSHSKEHPHYDRLAHGYLPWFSGVNGSCFWLYESTRDTWDDRIDKRNNYRQQCSIYQGAFGPVKTVQFYGAVNGAREYRLMALLEQRAKRIEARWFKNQEKKEWLIRVKKHLNEVPLKMANATLGELYEKLNHQDLLLLREKTLDLLKTSESWE